MACPLQIAGDRVTRLATQHWSQAALDADKPPAFNPELIDQIYKDELAGGADSPPALKRVMLLEVSQYLENYLWPHFDAATATTAHVMSIIMMVNEKFREGVPAWTPFHSRKVRLITQVYYWGAAYADDCQSVLAGRLYKLQGYMLL